MNYPGPYCIVDDDDGHHYVIPVDKEEEWSDWVESATNYWNEMKYDEEEPELPEWADSIGGCPSLVKFGLNNSSYVIR